MPLAILGFIFLAGILVYYLISTANSKNKDSEEYDEEIVYAEQEEEDKDNVILFPSDVEKEKKKRNIGKK
jgi:preprotein translocase subunit SecG